MKCLNASLLGLGDTHEFGLDHCQPLLTMFLVVINPHNRQSGSFIVNLTGSSKRTNPLSVALCGLNVSGPLFPKNNLVAKIIVNSFF